MKNKKHAPPPPANSSFSPVDIAVLIFLTASQAFLFFKFQSKFSFGLALNNAMNFFTLLQFPQASMWFFMLGHILMLMAVLSVAFFIGQLLSRMVKLTGLNAFEKWVIRELVGLCALGLIVFAMGFLGLYSKDVFFAATALILVAGFFGIFTDWKKPETKEAFASVLNRLRMLSWKPILFLLFFFPLLMSFVPEIFYDALVYHLGLPHLYLLEGRVVNTPNVQFGFFPLLVQSIYVYALALGGDALAKMIHFGFLLFGGLSIVALADRFDLPEAGSLGAICFASVPVVQINVWTTAVDVAMSSIALGGLLVAMVWMRSEKNDWASLVLSGFLAGCVFGTKYTGFLFVFGMNGFFLVGALRKRMTLMETISMLAVFNGVAFLTFCPWMIRNYFFSGNPLYPFLGKIFPNENLIPEKIAAQSALSQGYTPAKLWEWVLVPWTISFSGEGTSFDFLGPLIIGFLPAVYFLRKQIRELLPWVTSLILYFGVGFVLSRQTRYILPGIAVAAALSGLGAGALFKEKKWGPWGVLMRVSFFGTVLLLFCWAVTIAGTSYAPYNVLSGQETREAYRSYYHPGMNPYPPNNLFPAIDQLPRDAKLLFIGEEKVFGCPRPFEYSNVYDRTPFVMAANKAASADGLFHALRDKKITHIVLNLAEAMRLKGYDIFPWQPDKINLVKEFFSNAHKNIGDPTGSRHEWSHSSFAGRKSRAQGRMELFGVGLGNRF